MDLPSFAAEPASPAKGKDAGGGGDAGAAVEGPAALALAELIDRANAPIFAVDLDGGITEWNYYIAQAAGTARDAAVGKKLADYVAPESLKAMTDALKEMEGGTFGLPFELTFAAGSVPFSVLTTATPQMDAKGKVIGAMCLGQLYIPPASGGGGKKDKPTADIASNARKTKGMVMHELRSPLHGVIGLATTLSQDDSPMQKPLKMIGSSAERVLELVTNLMDYWNLADDPNQDVPQDPIDFPTLINESMARCEQAKDKRGRPMKKDKVNIIRDIPTSLPTMYGDPQAIIQLLYHLIMNALKFTHQGHVSIKIAPNNKTKSMDITIEDTGIGISKNSIKRVFEPFQQEDTSESRKYEGIGLGLAIVSEVVRLHGGTVDVNSVQDKGTTFIVSLPYKPGKNAGGGGSNVGKPPLTSAPKQPRASRPSLWLGPPNLLPPMPVAAGVAPAAGAAAPAAAAPAPAPAGGQACTTVAVPSGVPTGRKVPEVRRDGPRVIMSVDDDHINQEVMRSVLEPCGFKIIVCMNGTECLEHFQEDGAEIPDLILLDLMMPGLNGFDVLEEQRKTYPPELMPIILVSAKNQAASVVKGLELGCNDWIHKPFDRQELIARVNAHLRLRDVVLGYECLVSAPGGGGAAPEPAPAPAPAPAALPAPPPELPITVSVESTVLFMAIITPPAGDAALPRLFESFETLSSRLGVTRTEMVGCCYLAVAQSSVEEPKHTEKILQLALGLEDLIRQANTERDARQPLLCRIGIHTDSHVPAAIPSKWRPSGFKQYPMGCLFGRIMTVAKALGESPSRGCVVLSKSARSRLGPEAESHVRSQGLQMISGPAGDASSELASEGELFCLTRDGEQPHVPPLPDKPAPAATNGAVPQNNQALVDQLRAAEMQRQREIEEQSVKLREVEAHATRLGQGMQQQQQEFQARHRHDEELLMEARAEARNLRMQMEEWKSSGGGGGGKEHGSNAWQGAPSSGSLPRLPLWQPNVVATQSSYNNMGDSAASASALFLQWQNAHLNAELRSAHQALSAARAELQVQAVNAQNAERKQLLLMERAEHLELDLGFRAAMGGLSGFGAITGSMGSGAAATGAFGASGLGVSPSAAMGGGAASGGVSPVRGGSLFCGGGGAGYGGHNAGAISFGSLGPVGQGSAQFYSGGGNGFLTPNAGASFGAGMGHVGLGAGHSYPGGGMQDIGLMNSALGTMPAAGMGGI